MASLCRPFVRILASSSRGRNRCADFLACESVESSAISTVQHGRCHANQQTMSRCAGGFVLTGTRVFSTTHASLKERANKRHTGKQKPKLIVDDEEMRRLFDVDKYKKDLEKAVLDFRDELTKHFSLRTRIASFDSIPVTIGETKYKLNDIAQVTFRTPQLVMINMTSMPQHAKAVVEAISKSGMNVNPQMEGHLIFVPLPKVSRDHREQLAKNAKHALEAAKATVRKLQNANVSHVKIMPHVSEDVLHNASLMIMQEADACMAKLEELLRAKEQELLH